MKKRILLTALALILVCALSIMGTVAFLKDQTKEVVNTFVAAGGPGPFVDEVDGVKKFAIKEYNVVPSSTGKYDYQNLSQVEGEMVYNEVDAITYDKVMPGTTIPKQAFVKLSRTEKTLTVDGVTTSFAPAPAYLYIEVIDELPANVYTWKIDDTNWTQLKDAEGKAVVGPTGGDVYLYTGSKADGAHVVTTITAFDSDCINIIKNNEVKVADLDELPAETVTLKFNAFLAQASVGNSDDAATVFTSCFGNQGGQGEAPTPDPNPAG